MAELRRQIDAIDTELVALLAARDTARVGQVADKISATAADHGLDSDLVRALWGTLID